MSGLPKKESVDTKYRWNAESVFTGRDEWDGEYSAVMAELPGFAALCGSVSSGAGALFHVLSIRDALETRVATLVFYATMRSAVDSGDAEARSLESRAGGLVGRFSEAVAFVEPEILAIPQETVNSWIKNLPALAVYAHWLNDLFRQRAHVRSAEVEALLGAASEVFSGMDTIHDLLVDSDLRFGFAAGSDGVGRSVAQSNVEAFLSSPDRALRKSAWELFCDGHLAFAPTLAATLCGSVKRDIFLARARGYNSTLEAALFADNISLAVYDRTLDSFRERLPLWHRYWKVRAQALGLKRLSHWDIWAPLSKDSPKVSYEQAVEWIGSALTPLGSDYADTIKRGCLTERWVDVLPTEGKGSGAFSYGSPATHPFIKMSWNDDLSSLSTLTHELGHSMHSYNTWKKQPAVYCDYSIFVAEVASNFHQAMTRAWLFENMKDSEFQIALIEEAMENFHRYFFIMPILALFEREMHRRLEAGEGLTNEDLNTLMAGLFAEGYGDAMNIDESREGSTWAQFGHLYSNFYVFQYATGISAAHALAAPILDGDIDAVTRYREFLSTGSSEFPVEALKKAGVDMETGVAMDRAFEVLSGYIDRLEELVAARAD